MMEANRFLAATLLTCAIATQVHADSWGPIRQTEFFSANHKHMLKIDPHPDWPSNPGHCRATLFNGEKEVWSRDLINNHAPVRVYVADSGNYVLTMDEWHSVGKLPVVIYGRRGDLIRVHSTDTLGLKDDIRHIKMTVSSYWWNEDSISFFGPEEQKFLIRLHWGKWIVLDLRRGDLFQEEETFFRDDLRKQHEAEWQKLVKYRQQILAKHAMRMLGSKEASKRKTGALLCGQEKLKEAIPDLRKLLSDPAWFTTGSGDASTIVLFVRAAAKSALEAMGERVDGVVTELPEKGHLKYDRDTARYVVDFGLTERDEESIEPDKSSVRGKPRR